jgi:uncharacterized protein YerC
MVNVNKHDLSQKQQNQLFAQLNATLGKSNKQEVGAILTDLLGSEEKIMLAKRLGIIILLHEGNSIYKTSRVLKVSTSTITLIRQKLEAGKYKNLIAALKSSKTDYLSVLNTIDKILHLGGILPHYGKHHKIRL